MANHLLEDILKQAGWTPEQLARRITERLAHIEPHLSRRVHEKTPYKWLRGERPRDPVPEAAAAVLGERLGRTVTSIELGWPERSALLVSADDGLAGLEWGQRGMAAAAAELLRRGGVDGRMDRRKFIVIGGAALSTAALTWLVSEPEALAAALQGDRVSPHLMTAVERLATDLRHLYDSQGGGVALDWARRELHWVAELLNNASYDEQTGRRLHVALAEISEALGWMCFDTDRHGEAQRYWLVGLRAAHTADERALGANLLACLAYQLINLDKPADALPILRSAERGVDRATTPTVLAMLQERQAHAHAKLGDPHAAHSALNRADELLDSASPDDPWWIYWMSRPTLHATAGRCWVQLGRPDRADSELSQGLTTLDGEYSRDRLMYLTYLTEAHVQRRELEHAAYSGHQAIDLAETLNSPRCLDRVRHLHRQMTSHSDVPAVAEWLDRAHPLLTA